MAISDHDRLVRRLQTIAAVGEDERALLGTLPLRERRYGKGANIVRQGDKPSECLLILEGLAGRYQMTSRGRRQILSLHFSGDMPDLHSLQLHTMDHGIYALTRARAAFIAHDAMRALMRLSPRLSDILMRDVLIDASIFRQWITNIGQRTARERIAHLFCEVFVRMGVLGLAEAHSFRFPITQAELGDATGLSPVHVNRVLQSLRKAGLIASRGDVHEITDWPGLRAAADFSDDYLHLRSDHDHAA
jgi:CRP-like cAMP-binding protein